MHTRNLAYFDEAQFCCCFVCGSLSAAHLLSLQVLELLATELNVCPVGLRFSVPSILSDHLSLSHPSLLPKIKPLFFKQNK
jgi:hypothetical protein